MAEMNYRVLGKLWKHPDFRCWTRELFERRNVAFLSLSLSRFVHKIFLQSIYLNGFRGNSKARANVDEREREKEVYTKKAGD